MQEETTGVRRSLVVDGVAVPTFVYGTAWKEAETERLTRLALEAGFRGIDTANQRRHYFEAGVGEALKKAFDQGLVRREELFLRTKFTHQGGQDHRLPYDPRAPIAVQVRQSFESSLEHLGVDRIDSLVLHGPSLRHGLADEDVEAWRAMEELHREGRVGLLGVSNVDLQQLEELFELAEQKPRILQDRCYARFGWNRELRRFCRDHGILHQGFSLLTANRAELGSPSFRALVERLGWSSSQVVFRFALQAGSTCLTGTTSRDHMLEDLRVFELELSDEEMALVETIGEQDSTQV